MALPKNDTASCLSPPKNKHHSCSGGGGEGGVRRGVAQAWHCTSPTIPHLPPPSSSCLGYIKIKNETYLYFWRRRQRQHGGGSGGGGSSGGGVGGKGVCVGGGSKGRKTIMVNMEGEIQKKYSEPPHVQEKSTLPKHGTAHPLSPPKNKPFV